MEISIRRMTAQDWPIVREIYREGIATGNATFETEVPDWDRWNDAHLADCRLVAERDGRILGWVALSPVSRRQVYRGVAEVSIYVAEAARGTGIGRTLLLELIAGSESCGIWTLQAGIFPENRASVELHKSCGFREVGIRERIAALKGVWRNDVLLERRSEIVGR